MTRIFVHGLGAVSPAGWGVGPLREALHKGQPIPVQAVTAPGDKRLQVRPVPPPPQRPPFLAHPRLRRSSVISQHVVGSALEALGEDANRNQRLGILVCLMSGCVTYSRRFFEEVLTDPFMASPLLFPETVFNASASHLAAYLNSPQVSYTLVGDDSAFVQGLATGAGMLLDGRLDGCLVIGAEETDWIVAGSLRLFSPGSVQAGGAGAVYLRREPSAVELGAITDAVPFSSNSARAEAARKVRAQMPVVGNRSVLCLGTQGLPAADAAELAAWADWNAFRIAPKALLGEAFTASAAWQCVVASDLIARGEFDSACVSVVGINQQAVAAQFMKSTS